MATRRFPALAVVAALALAFVAALLLSRRAGEPEHGPLRPAEATRVADVARAVVAPVADPSATRVAVLAAPGVGLTNPPPRATATPAPEEPVVGEGTPAPDITAVAEQTPPARGAVDTLHGLAAVSVDRGASTPVALGRSDALEVGDQVVLAGGVVEPVVARFAGQATVQLGSSILSQVLLDLELPSGRAAAPGAVLDRQGRLVGIVVPERQAGAPAGHVYAVPVEQAAGLLNRVGATPG